MLADRPRSSDVPSSTPPAFDQPTIPGEAYRSTPVMSKPSTPGWTQAKRSGIAFPTIIHSGGFDAGYRGNSRTAGVRAELHRLSVADILCRLGRLVARCHRFRSVLAG